MNPLLPEKVLSPTNWDVRYFSLARLVSSWSEDESRKVGAVIIGPAKEVRSLGFNGLPRRVSATPRNRHSKEDGEKYLWFEHAERNAIFNAARVGIPLEGCSIYSTLFPCSDCIRAIAQSGLLELNTFEPPNNDDHYRRSFEVSIEIALEVGLRVRFFEPNIST